MIHTQSTSVEDLVRIFNTALVTSRVESGRAYADEMMDMVQTPAFRAILKAIRDLAAETGVQERLAAEQIIHAFRKMDALWTDYLIQEGVQRLKGPPQN